MTGVILLTLGWLGAAVVAALKAASVLRYERLSAGLEAERARLAEQVSRWQTPEVPLGLRALLAELTARNAVSSSALRERGRMVADDLRTDFEHVPDIVLAAIIGYLTRGLDGVEGIAARERLDALGLVRIVLTAAAAELSAVELETA